MKMTSSSCIFVLSVFILFFNSQFENARGQAIIESSSVAGDVITDLTGICGRPITFERTPGGGQAQLGAHPWMVGLGYKNSQARGSSASSPRFNCGGSLITSLHVLTGATCVHPSTLGSNELVQLNIGDWNIKSEIDCEVVDVFGSKVCAPPVQVKYPEVITWHPQYNSNGRYNNDIAVIRLNEPVQRNPYVSPICIPNSFWNNGADYSMTVATGWGTNSDGELADILKEVPLPFVDFTACNASFGGILTEHQFCAGGEEGKDTCFGDSGGPLVAGLSHRPPFMQVGIISFGKNPCGQANNFGVYTNVADYRTWIEETLKL